MYLDSSYRVDRSLNLVLCFLFLILFCVIHGQGRNQRRLSDVPLVRKGSVWSAPRESEVLSLRTHFLLAAAVAQVPHRGRGE